MRLVAITATDTCAVHLALQEGTVFVNLAIDLVVGVIELLGQQRGQMAVQQGSVMVIAKQLRAAVMAACADLDFRMVAGRLLCNRVTGSWINRPDFAKCLIQSSYQALGGVGRDFFLGPIHMPGTRTMTGFAGNIDFRPSGMVAMASLIVVLLKIG